jgi:serine-type D-Ala-D-Ala carboxypeptidase (penicillin-binding protein 5/6)
VNSLYRLICFIIVLFSLNVVFAYDFEITSKSAIVCDLNSDTILYSKNIDKKIYPASTTKVLTAILAIENLDLNQTISVTKKALDLVPLNSSSMNLKVGDIVTVNDLLHGLLLVSGGDAANVLAEAVSKTNKDFIKLLNEKLKELDCKNSNFTNAHGFHDDNHYTTCSDMSKVLKYVFKNETFKKICSTNEYIYNNRKLISTNELLYEDLPYTIIGKTGYTEQAGNVFVSYSKNNEKEFVTCIYDGNKNILNKEIRFTETKKLFDYCFETYNKEKIIDSLEFNINFIDKNNNKIYISKINEDLNSYTDKNIYIVKYNIENIEDVNYSRILFNIGNDNFTSSHNYKLNLYDTVNYNNPDNIINYYYIIPISLIIISFILLIFNMPTKRNKYRRKKE